MPSQYLAQRNQNVLNANLSQGMNNNVNMTNTMQFNDKEYAIENAPMVNTSIIILSYVLRFNALPGIETEIPLVVTTEGFRTKSHQNINENSSGRSSKVLINVDSSQPTCSKTAKAPNPSILQDQSSPKKNNSTRKRVSIFEMNKSGSVALFYC